MAGAVVPEAPAVGIGILTIGAAVGFAFAWALDVFYRNTVHPVITRIADIGFGGVKGVGAVHPFHFLSGVDETWLRWIRNMKATTESAMVRGFHIFVNFQVAVAHNIAQTTVDVYDAMHRLQFYWTPYFIGVKLKPIHESIGNLKAEHSHTAAKSHPNTKVAVKNITYKVTRVQKITQTQTAVAHAGAVIKPNEWHNVKTQIAKLHWLIALGGLVAFGNALFKTFKLGWLRCPSLVRMGNRFGCGGFQLLESLLAETFEAMLILDLCRMAVAMQTLAREIVPALGVFLLVEDAVCLGGGASLPSAHDSPKVSTAITLPSGF